MSIYTITGYLDANQNSNFSIKHDRLYFTILDEDLDKIQKHLNLGYQNPIRSTYDGTIVMFISMGLINYKSPRLRKQNKFLNKYYKIDFIIKPYEYRSRSGKIKGYNFDIIDIDLKL